MQKRLEVEVWSDIACPWCYVGKRRLETALREFQHADQVSVRWHAFELDPAAPRSYPASPSPAERLAKKYGVSVEHAKNMTARLTRVAAAEGLQFQLERIQSGNTFDAHRLLCLAKQRDLQEQLEERFMHAYLCEGAAIGEHATLLSLASEVGLDADEAQSVLATDAYASEVRANERAAGELGIGGVPFFRIGRYGVSGAQPAELLLSGLQRAWDELPQRPVPLAGDGEMCGPDGCTP